MSDNWLFSLSSITNNRIVPIFLVFNYEHIEAYVQVNRLSRYHENETAGSKHRLLRCRCEPQESKVHETSIFREVFLEMKIMLLLSTM